MFTGIFPAEAMPTYKLTYFNARGLAECARYMFKLKGQDFEDVRLSREQPEFNEAKARAPFGQLPILEVEGMDTPICQSRAIERFLARRFGQSETSGISMSKGNRSCMLQWNLCLADLLGKNENDTTKCDVVVCCIDDVKMGMMEIFRAKEDEKVHKCITSKHVLV